MNTQKYRFDGSKEYKPGAVKPEETEGLDKAKAVEALEKNRLRMEELQEALYADGSQALLVIFQAMDAAGKDGAVKHVFSGINPQGIQVASFKEPSALELEHDYLWRVHAAAPRRGMIGVFNRSHYEDVLVGRVLDLPKGQNLPAKSLKDIWAKRYRQIRDFERHLYENGTTILKFYLCLSKEEQSQRFLDRLDAPEKNYKFSMGDLSASERWDDYMKAYKEAINETAAPHAPWYVVPADHKWFTRLAVSEVVLETLKKMNPQYPALDKEQLRGIAAAKAKLEGAKPGGKEAKKPGKKEDRTKKK